MYKNNIIKPSKMEGNYKYDFYQLEIPELNMSIPKTIISGDIHRVDYNIFLESDNDYYEFVESLGNQFNVSNTGVDYQYLYEDDSNIYNMSTGFEISEKEKCEIVMLSSNHDSHFIVTSTENISTEKFDKALAVSLGVVAEKKSKIGKGKHV